MEPKASEATNAPPDQRGAEELASDDPQARAGRGGFSPGLMSVGVGSPWGTPAQISRSRQYRRRESALNIVLIVLATQVASVIFALADPNRFAYLTQGNVVTGLETLSYTAIVALGVGILMIAGEFDLSVGANYAFSSIIMAQLATNGMNSFVAALIGVLIGLGIGLLNGVATLTLKIPSFIATLGTMGVWTAATLYFHGSSAQSFAPTSNLFNKIFDGTIGGWIPAEFVWLIVLALLAGLLLQRHRIGNHLFAAGGGQPAARASGVAITRTKMIAFALAGLCAAVAGILAASRVGAVSPTDGQSLTLSVIAACVVGGVLLTGGVGTIFGVCLGAFLLYWIQDVLLLLGAPSFYLTAFVGGLTIAAASTYAALRRRGEN